MIEGTIDEFYFKDDANEETHLVIEYEYHPPYQWSPDDSQFKVWSGAEVYFQVRDYEGNIFETTEAQDEEIEEYLHAMGEDGEL